MRHIRTNATDGKSHETHHIDILNKNFLKMFKKCVDKHSAVMYYNIRNKRKGVIPMYDEEQLLCATVSRLCD